MQKLLLTLAFSVATTFAANIVAVLEIVPSNENVDLEISEFRHLTDELRTRARETLPRAYSILTRDNIISLLPPDEAEAECLAESCAVEIGRAIGAEYVTQGFIGKFAGMLTLTVELYESMSGNMLGSFVTESEDVKGLLMTIREKAPKLFSNISVDTKVAVTDSIAPIQPTVSLSSSANKSPLPTSQKSNTSFLVALSLDILGAAAIGFGIYKHMDSNKLYSDYEKKSNLKKLEKEDPEMIQALKENPELYEAYENDRNKLLKKSNDARTLRNVGYAVGGALLAAGIAVHIWF
jgi:hypothetical protein